VNTVLGENQRVAQLAHTVLRPRSETTLFYKFESNT